MLTQRVAAVLIQRVGQHPYAQNDPLDQVDPLGLSPVRDAGLRAVSSVPIPPVSVVVGRVSTQGPVASRGVLVSTRGIVVQNTVASAAAAPCIVNNNVAFGNLVRIDWFLKADATPRCAPWLLYYLQDQSQLNSYFRYLPEKKSTDAGQRMEEAWDPKKVPYCSVPRKPTQADMPWGFNFRHACRVHDYSYDIIRFCAWPNSRHRAENYGVNIKNNTWGSCGGVWGSRRVWTAAQVKDARIRTDNLFASDLSKVCDRASSDEWLCRFLQFNYAQAVAVWSSHEGYGIPS